MTPLICMFQVIKLLNFLLTIFTVSWRFLQYLEVDINDAKIWRQILLLDLVASSVSVTFNKVLCSADVKVFFLLNYGNAL